jgi:phosphate transport system protein
MFSLLDVQLEKATLALTNQDLELEVALQNENKIDKLDLKIDKLCQKIFALAQPVATDLRFIMSSLKIANEIERMGDISLDIISRSESVRSYPDLLRQYRVNELVSLLTSLNKSITECYANNNTELSKELLVQCKQTEEDCKNLFNDIVAKMAEKSEVITIATDLILIIRDIERIAGHLSNVGESVVFIVEGIRLRHAGLRVDPE